MAEGIILAAGYSSRTKQNKMLFSIRGKSLIRHAIEGMKPFVSHVFIVTGHYDDAIREEVADIGDVTCILNSQYDLGMFGSIQTAVKVISDDFFVLPGDCPFVDMKTYEALLHGTREMRVPSYEGRKGHPLWVAKHLIKPLLDEPIESNLKAFRNRCDLEIINVDDPKILNDIDTIEDYQKIERQHKED